MSHVPPSAPSVPSADMWLQLQFTFARNASFAAIARGQYDNIRLMSGDSQSQGLSPAVPPTHPWRRIQDAAALPASDPDSLDTFSAPCYHFAEALTDQFVAAGKPPPTLGLLNMAIGGSMIEEWVTNEVVSQRRQSSWERMLAAVGGPMCLHHPCRPRFHLTRFPRFLGLTGLLVSGRGLLWLLSKRQRREAQPRTVSCVPRATWDERVLALCVLRTALDPRAH
jgi:hypothetical protein